MTEIWKCPKCEKEYRDPIYYYCPFDKSQLAMVVDIKKDKEV